MTAKVPVKLWASVGDGGVPVYIETIGVPIKADATGLVIDLSRQVQRLRDAMSYYRFDDGEDGE